MIGQTSPDLADIQSQWVVGVFLVDNEVGYNYNYFFFPFDEQELCPLNSDYTLKWCFSLGHLLVKFSFKTLWNQL